MGHSTVDYNEVGEKAKAYFWKKGEKTRSSLFLTELIIFSEGVGGFKKQQQRGVGKLEMEYPERLEICDVMSFILWGIHFLIIPLGQPFPLYSPAIKHPPYGTFGKGHDSAPQQAGIRGEPGHLKCADTSLSGMVNGVEVMGGVGRRE